MTRGERIRWYTLTVFRALLAILDLVGVMAIGFVVTSTALFLTSGSDPNRVLQFAGLSLPAANAQTLPYFGAGILMLFLTKAVLSILLTKKSAFFVAKIEARAAKQIAQNLFGSGLETARRGSPEELMYAIQIGSPNAFNILLNQAGTIVSEGFLFLLIVMGFAVIDPVATILAVIYFGIIGGLIQYFIGSLMRKAGRVSAEGALRANTALTDLVSVFRELTVLGLKDRYVERLYDARLRAADSSANQFYLSGMPRYIVESALLIGVSVFILIQALTGDIVASAGVIGVFLSGGFRLTASMLPLQNALLSISNVLPSASTAYEYLELSKHVPARSTSDSKATSIAEKPGPVGVRFDNVSFTYQKSSQLVLEKLSLEVEPGTQVALIGTSGAGKSTIADLICGVLEPTSGQVQLISNIRTAGVGEKHIQQRIAYIPQKPGLVSGSIATNVALGINSGEVDRDRVLNALNDAHLSEVVLKLPEGIDTELGKLKEGLSGGQIQRIGLARALYSKPGLLVLDEATSALDAESELEIQNALNEMKGEVTVVLIAHRLNTVQHCDKVFLIEEGRVADQGAFQELVSRNTSVKRLVELMKIDERAY